MPEPRERLYAVACAAMFAFGIILGLPGTVLGLPDVVERFGLTLAERGSLIATLFFGILAGSVLSGPVIQKLGQRSTLVASALLVGACLPLFAASSSFAVAIAALAAVGIVSAGMNTASNALSSDLFPEQRGMRMNGLALSVGLGGLALPAVTALGSGAVSWQMIVTAGGALSASVGVCGACIGSLPARSGSGPDQPSAGALKAFQELLRQRQFAWFCVLLMLGAGTEASLAGWTSTFLQSAGFTSTAATWTLSSHWLGLIVGRVLFAARVDGDKRAAIMRGAAAGAVLTVLFLTVRSPLVLAAGPFVIGIAIAIVVPTMLALAGERFRGDAGTLFGTLLTLAQVGGMACPALIGLGAESLGLRTGLSAVVLYCGAVVLVARGIR